VGDRTRDCFVDSEAANWKKPDGIVGRAQQRPGVRLVARHRPGRCKAPPLFFLCRSSLALTPAHTNWLHRVAAYPGQSRPVPAHSAAGEVGLWSDSMCPTTLSNSTWSPQILVHTADPGTVNVAGWFRCRRCTSADLRAGSALVPPRSRPPPRALPRTPQSRLQFASHAEP
jgi:hypothetical protein